MALALGAHSVPNWAGLFVFWLMPVHYTMNCLDQRNRAPVF